MSDLRKVRETRTKDDGDWDEWPYPTLTIESVISGDLRTRALSKLGRPDHDGEVLLIESHVSAGWSEYTQEDDYSIEVSINGESAWKDEYNYSTESAMAQFLKWIGQ